MTVIDITKDPDTLTMTIDTAFDAPIERTWTVWADPRVLERWWGPPTYPATFVEHDLRPGGRAAYFMTGPEGDRHHGWWEFLEVEPLRRIVLRDGFADGDGVPDATMPVSLMEMTMEAAADGSTTMRLVTTFPSAEAMEQMVAMGMEEGIRLALGQIDALVDAG